MPEGEEYRMPEGEAPSFPEGDGRGMPQGGFGGRDPMAGMTEGETANVLFYMQDMVNFFSGIEAAQ